MKITKDAKGIIRIEHEDRDMAHLAVEFLKIEQQKREAAEAKLAKVMAHLGLEE